MSLITSIGVTIGLALAKSMISTWTSGASEQVIHDLIDLSGEQARGWFVRKKEDDPVARLAPQVVTAMNPLWQTESRRLNEDDREAVVFALARTLVAGRIDADALVQHRLDGGKLADTLAKKSARQTVGFSPDEKAVYRRLLGETCAHIVYIANHMAGYEPLVNGHVLVSLDQLLLSTAQLLAGPAGAESEYEKEYRNALPNLLERFDVIGITYAEDAVRRLGLSEAYVDLRLEVDPLADGVAGKSGDAESVTIEGLDPLRSERLTTGEREERRMRAGNVAFRSGPIQEMLARSARLVIRGQPGSGKSTLLRWLAVRAARRQLRSEAARLASWDEAIPFYLRLREFKDSGLPNPSEWPRLLTPMLALKPPDGWIHRVLSYGRGLVLIDGIDEVAVAQRKTMLDALQQVMQTYPLARYVITSRPAALRNWPEWNEWTRNAGFLSVTLQEMELDQVNTFVDRWHDALLRASTDETTRRQIRPLPAALKQLLRGRPPLRRLARNPLLCTMICALHSERPYNMPENRVKLYQDCVQMLLYERDTAKNVGSMDDYPRLTHTHEEVVLSEYAHHLLTNAVSEESAAEVETFFGNLLKTINMPKWDGPKLCDFMIKRTGLLIEPATGQVAFAHRTFLEYLAAKAMVRKNDIKVLLKNAGDDQWRETILLTMALSEISEVQSRGLLQGLLDQAQMRDEGRARQELQLLAVACLESPIYLLKDLREIVLAQATALIPPRSADEVALLAKAGDPLVELLVHNPRWNADAMARCVAVLAAIGSERALEAIAGYSASPSYAADSRGRLLEAVAAAMWSFDPAEYCRRVLGHVTILDFGKTPLRDDDLVHLAALSSLQVLYLISTQVSDAGLADLARLSSLQRLDLSNTQVSDAGLAQLTCLSSLQRLDLSRTRVSDAGLAHLAALSGLQTLDLSSTQVSDVGLAHLARLSGLQTLDLSNTQVSDAGLAHLAHLSGLQRLYLSGTQVSNAGLVHLARLSGLQTLHLGSTEVSNAGLVHLARLSSLQTLYLGNTQVSDAGLAHLAHLSDLQVLDLSGTRVTSRRVLGHLKHLKVHY